MAEPEPDLPRGIYPMTKHQATKHTLRPPDNPSVILPRTEQEDDEESEACLPVLLRVLQYDALHRAAYRDDFRARHDAAGVPRTIGRRAAETAYEFRAHVQRRRDLEGRAGGRDARLRRLFEAEMRKDLGRVFQYPVFRDGTTTRESFYAYALGKAREYVRGRERRRVAFQVRQRLVEQGREEDRHFVEVWLKEKVDAYWPFYKKRLLATAPRYVDGYPYQDHLCQVPDSKQRQKRRARLQKPRGYSPGRDPPCIQCAAAGIPCRDVMPTHDPAPGEDWEKAWEASRGKACRSCVLRGWKHECLMVGKPDGKGTYTVRIAEPREEILPVPSGAYDREVEDVFWRWIARARGEAVEVVGRELGVVVVENFVMPERPAWYYCHLRAVGGEEMEGEVAAEEEEEEGLQLAETQRSGEPDKHHGSEGPEDAEDGQDIINHRPQLDDSDPLEDFGQWLLKGLERLSELEDFEEPSETGETSQSAETQHLLPEPSASEESTKGDSADDQGDSQPTDVPSQNQIETLKPSPTRQPQSS